MWWISSACWDGRTYLCVFTSSATLCYIDWRWQEYWTFIQSFFFSSLKCYPVRVFFSFCFLFPPKSSLNWNQWIWICIGGDEECMHIKNRYEMQYFDLIRERIRRAHAILLFLFSFGLLEPIWPFPWPMGLTCWGHDSFPILFWLSSQSELRAYLFNFPSHELLIIVRMSSRTQRFACKVSIFWDA